MRARLAAIVAITAVSAFLVWLAFVFVEDGPGRYLAVLAILALVVGVLQVPGVLPAQPPAPQAPEPPPDLVVEFRSRHRSLVGRPVLTRNTDAHYLQVWVVNNGSGAAEAVEVTFDGAAAFLYNESGNAPDRQHLDPTVHPYRWMGGERTIAPHDELPIAMLTWRDTETPRPTEIGWTARARNMRPRHGVAKIQVFDTAAEAGSIRS